MDVINVVTAPEIEMLIVASENKFVAFKKSKMKPSDFCKEVLKLRTVKNYDFVKSNFSDANKLIKAIKDFSKLIKPQKGEYRLVDLLKR